MILKALADDAKTIGAKWVVEIPVEVTAHTKRLAGASAAFHFADITNQSILVVPRLYSEFYRSLASKPNPATSQSSDQSPQTANFLPLFVANRRGR